MSARITVFRGEDLRYPVVRRDRAGFPASLADTTISAWLVNGSAALPAYAEITDESGGAFDVVQLASETATWPLGLLPVFVRYVQGPSTDIDNVVTAWVRSVPLPEGGGGDDFTVTTSPGGVTVAWDLEPLDFTITTSPGGVTITWTE